MLREESVQECQQRATVPILRDGYSPAAPYVAMRVRLRRARMGAVFRMITGSARRAAATIATLFACALQRLAPPSRHVNISYAHIVKMSFASRTSLLC